MTCHVTSSCASYETTQQQQQQPQHACHTRCSSSHEKEELSGEKKAEQKMQIGVEN
jgi:hypothetical protein